MNHREWRLAITELTLALLSAKSKRDALLGVAFPEEVARTLPEAERAAILAGRAAAGGRLGSLEEIGELSLQLEEDTQCVARLGQRL